MDGHALGIYLEELESQSLMALGATTVLNEFGAITREQRKAMTLEQKIQMNKEYFRSIHSFLTHLSNISRLLWPPALSPKQHCFCDKPKALGRKCGTCVARERSQCLLVTLDMNEHDHVLKNRSLRDHLEHFDERLDHWMVTSERRNYVQDHIGAKGAIQGVEDTDMMRQYDPASGDFTFRGETHSLFALFEGMREVLERTRAASEKLQVVQREEILRRLDRK